MQPHYSPTCPLGFNESRFSPHIPFYISWDELFNFTKTGIITDTNGRRYLIPDAKEDRPMFTYKGNFGVRRNNTNFTGERSPYIAIDIDIDEKAAGLSKYSLTEEQRVKASSDIDKLIDELSEGRRDFFFCKRTSSGCGS